MTRRGGVGRWVSSRKSGYRILKPTTYIIKLPEMVRMDYWPFWILLGLASLVIVYAFSNSPADGAHNELFLPFIVIGAAVWVAVSINMCVNRLDRFLHEIDKLCCDPDGCRTRMKEYIDKVYSLKWHVVAGIIMCLAMTSLICLRTDGFSSAHEWYGGKYGYWPFLVSYIIMSFFVGAGFIAVVGTMLIPRRLSKEMIKINIHSYKKSGIRDMSTMFLKFSGLIFIAALFAVVGVILSPYPNDPGLILMYFGFLWISFMFFIWTQWGIHEVLVKGKLVILDRLTEKFEQELDRIRKGSKLEAGIEDQVNLIFALRREVISFPDWTINLGNLGGALTPSLSGSVAIFINFKREIFALFGVGG